MSQEGEREFRSVESTEPEPKREHPPMLLAFVVCTGTTPEQASDVAIQAPEKPCRLQVRWL